MVVKTAPRHPDQKPSGSHEARVGVPVDVTPTNPPATPNRAASGSDLVPQDHGTSEAHSTSVLGGDTLDPTTTPPDTQHPRVGSDLVPQDQSASEAQRTSVLGDNTLDPTVDGTTPIAPTSGSDLVPQDQGHPEAQAIPVLGDDTLDPTIGDAVPSEHPSGPILHQTNDGPTPKISPSGVPSENPTDQKHSGAQEHGVGGGSQLALASFILDLAATSLDDIERTRIAFTNRLGAMERDGMDGLPEYKRLKAHAEFLADLEHQATLDVQRALRKHPLGGWVKGTLGVGEKQGGRLIAAIGDPFWNALEDRPRRGPAELWAYCGYHTLPSDQTSPGPQGRSVAGNQLPADQRRPDTHEMRVGGKLAGDQAGFDAQRSPVPGNQLPADHHGPDTHSSTVGGKQLAGDPERADAHSNSVPGNNVAAKRRRGQRANWNAAAKMRAFLVAESCVKCMASPYRAIYDAERLKWADRDTSDGHKHNHALRLVAKAVLRDLWREGKRVHESENPTDHRGSDTHASTVGGGSQ